MYILFSSISSSPKANSSNRRKLHNALNKDSQKNCSLAYTENNLTPACMQMQFQTNFREKNRGKKEETLKTGRLICELFDVP